MTFLDVVFPYEPPISAHEMSSLSAIHEVYGIRLMKFNARLHTVTIEYDASRLTKSDIEFMLRNAGLRILTAEPDQASTIKRAA